jgi:hypothetical protein
MGIGGIFLPFLLLTYQPSITESLTFCNLCLLGRKHILDVYIYGDAMGILGKTTVLASVEVLSRWFARVWKGIFVGMANLLLRHLHGIFKIPEIDKLGIILDNIFS